jgi:thiol-disulfide isomerase/thioredoxin
MANYTIEYIGATWCAPCKVAKPIVSVIAHKFAVPLILKDYDEMEEEERADIKKLPTVRVYSNKDVIHEITTNHADSLELWLRNHVRVNEDADF